MKKGFNTYQLSVFLSLSFTACNYLFLHQIIDAFIVFVITFLTGIFLGHFYKLVESNIADEKAVNSFVANLIEEYNESGNILESLQYSLQLLANRNIKFSEQDIIDNPDILDGFVSGVLLEPLKLFINNPNNVRSDVMLKIAKQNMRVISKKNFVKKLKDSIVFSLCFILLFVFVRYIFGEQLVNYSSVVFRIVSDILFITPIFVVTLVTVLKEKEYENEII